MDSPNWVQPTAGRELPGVEILRSRRKQQADRSRLSRQQQHEMKAAAIAATNALQHRLTRQNSAKRRKLHQGYSSPVLAVQEIESEDDQSFSSESAERPSDSLPNAASVRRTAARNQTRAQHLARISVNHNLTEDELIQKLDDASWQEQRDQPDQQENDAAEQDHGAPGDERDSSEPSSGESFFDDFTKNPIKSLLLFYLNSGMMRFHKHRDYMARWDGKDTDVQALIDEIKSDKLTDSELQNLLTEFESCHSYIGGELPACGCCGLRVLERDCSPEIKYRRLFLDDLLAAPLLYSEDNGELQELQTDMNNPACRVDIPIDENWNMRSVELWKLRSIYRQPTEEGGTSYWHMHPELVSSRNESSRPYTLACPVCTDSLKKGKRPPLSVAGGVDFGFYKRIGLTLPNLLELQILSRTRLFFATMKVSSNLRGVVNSSLQNSYKCHAILFPHDAPEVASFMFESDVFAPGGMLDFHLLKGLMQIYMVDDKSNVDNLFRHVFGTAVITARPWVVAQWLTVMKWSNPHYADLNIENLERTTSVIERLNTHIKSSTVRTTDPDVVSFEQTIGCDVAQVEHTEVLTAAETALRLEETNERDTTDVREPPVTYTYVTQTEQGYLVEDPTHDFRAKALRKLSNMNQNEITQLLDTPDGLDDLIFDQRNAVDEYLHKFPNDMQSTSARSAEPLSDFTKDDSGLGTCFPHIFMLGKAYKRPPGRLSSDIRHHLLNQFTMVPSQDRRLLGLLFDVMQRIKVFDGVKAYVDGNAHSLQRIKQLIEDPEERAALKDAIDYPYSDKSKRVFAKYFPHLRYAGKKVAYGAVEGSALQHQMAGLNNRYSAVSAFVTISPSNQDNPRALRCTFRTADNDTFPTKFEQGCPYGANAKEFFERFNSTATPEAEGFITLPKDKRSDLSMTNPVAFVQENKLLLHDIMHLLIGLPPENAGFYSKMQGASRRKTRYYRSRKGIFGYPHFVCGVVEDHQKGTLHVHINIAAGLTAYLLQRFSNLPEICSEITATLDSMYCSQLSPVAHVSTYVRQCLLAHYKTWDLSNTVGPSIRPKSVLCARAPLFTAIQAGRTDQMTPEVFNRSVDQQGALQNEHKHMSRCFKPPYGLTGCGLDLPMCCIDKTSAVLLVPHNRGSTEESVPVAHDMAEDIGYVPPEDDNSSESSSLPSTQEAEQYLTGRPPAEYTAHPLPSNNVDLPAAVYKLHTVASCQLNSDLVVWETSRPPLSSNEFSADLETVSDQKNHVLSSFKNYMNDPHLSVVSGDSVVFWNWMVHEADTDQLCILYNYVKDRLPLANGYVAAFNPALSFCTGSHNNSCVLGSLTQARSAMFYLIPYEAKRKVALEHSLPILEEVLQHIRRYPSEAADTGTNNRTVKHFLTRVLNRMHLKMEISDYQVAAALLDLPSMFTTDRFSYGNPDAMANLVGKMEIGQDRNESFSHICDELDAAERQAGTMGRSLVQRWSNSNNDSHNVLPTTNTANSDHQSTTAYDKYAVGRELGHIMQAKINVGGDISNPERKVLFPKTAWYYYRGEQLQDMTYYEYLACVENVNRKPSSKPDNPLNFKTQTQFKMSEDFICHADSFQILKNKQCTPLTIGTAPPHPGAQPENTTSDTASIAKMSEWKSKADLFARFFLSYFRPHQPGQSLTWESLQEYIHQLQHSTRIVDTFRLTMMDQHMKGMRIPNKCIKNSRHYRARCRDLWSPEQKAQHYIDRAREKALKRSAALLPNMNVQEDLEGEVSQKTMLSWKGQLHHDAKQSQLLEKLSKNIPCSSQKTIRHNRRSIHVLSATTTRKIQLTVDSMKDWKQSAAPTRKRKQGSSSHKQREDNMKRVRHSLLTQPGNIPNQQTALLDEYIPYFACTVNKKRKRDPPRMLLLHGPPGAGKTTTRNAFHKLADICDRFKFKVSFNSINAAEMGGFTICSHIGTNAKLHMTDTGDFAVDAIQRLRDLGFQEDSLITIEEFETCAPWHLARLSHLCKIANNNDKPFGGCLVLLIGDLGQLCPVKAGANLTQAVMDIHLDADLRKRASKAKVKIGDSVLPPQRHEDVKYMKSAPYRIGADLLTGSYWYELSEQHRSQDSLHTEVITKSYTRQTITFEDLKNRDYKILSASDIEKEEWLRAPALVVTNRERFSLTHKRAIDLAKFLGKPVIRWMSNYGRWRNKPNDCHLAEAQTDPCFWEVFVEDTDGYLTDNYMKKLRLVNGTKIRYHSLSFHNDEQYTIAKAHIEHAHPGTTIDLPFAPLAVIVEIFMPDETEPEILDALYSFSLDTTAGPNRRLLLPIYDHNTKWTSNSVAVRGSDNFDPSSVYLKSVFPIEPAFAITIHKALGRTIDRVILALSGNKPSGCNLSYRQLHVALSRVRMRSHIRLLLVGETEADQWHSLTYLKSLKPDPSIEYFFAGFRTLNPRSPNTNWQENIWEPARANDWYRDSGRDSRK